MWPKDSSENTSVTDFSVQEIHKAPSHTGPHRIHLLLGLSKTKVLCISLGFGSPHGIRLNMQSQSRSDLSAPVPDFGSREFNGSLLWRFSRFAYSESRQPKKWVLWPRGRRTGWTFHPLPR